MKIAWAILLLLAPCFVQAGQPTVRVNLLDHTDKKETKTRFWIDWSDKWRGIVETKIASDEDAVKIEKLLLTSLQKSEAHHFFGHEPIYGVEVWGSDGTFFQTSLCFSCLTWVKPHQRLNIAGSAGIENELCKALRNVIELPKELLLEEKPTPSVQR